jgi:hypothetical protein
MAQDRTIGVQVAQARIGYARVDEASRPALQVQGRQSARPFVNILDRILAGRRPVRPDVQGIILPQMHVVRGIIRVGAVVPVGRGTAQSIRLHHDQVVFIVHRTVLQIIFDAVSVIVVVVDKDYRGETTFQEAAIWPARPTGWVDRRIVTDARVALVNRARGCCPTTPSFTRYLVTMNK